MCVRVYVFVLLKIYPHGFLYVWVMVITDFCPVWLAFPDLK